MCHLIFLATQNPVQCKDFSPENFRVNKAYPEESENDFVKNNLSLPYWYNIFISPNDTCSCGFRIRNKEIGFTDKLDWYPEEESALLSTKLLFRAIKELLKTNQIVEILPTWNGYADDIMENNFSTQNYFFDDLKENTFCLFDNVKFVIKN